MATRPGVLLAADWSKNSDKRAVYKADVAERAIARVNRASWSLEGLLATAREEVQSGNGPVIISLDLVLGTPAPYFQEVQKIRRWKRAGSFIDWLSLLGSDATFWQTKKKGLDWSIQQPFFSAPTGKGSLKAFYARVGYELRRRVDIRCRSKSPFMVSGIAGTVGSGTRCLWQELAPLVSRERDFRVWPFEGRMSQLLEDQDIIVAENYPGVSYTSVIAPRLPSPRVKVYKTNVNHRIAALEQLEKATWVAAASVKLPNLEPARALEDDFDALMTAAGELRCVLENRALDDVREDDPVAEGGVLLTSVIDFDQKGTVLEANRANDRPTGQRRTKKTISSPRNFPCPIPRCGKIFVGTRSGWDSHAGSLSQHPKWHPDVKEPKQRRRLFKDEFPAFFR